MKRTRRYTRKRFIAMAAIITATASVEAFLGGMITVEALRGQTVLSGSNAAVETSKVEAEVEDTGLYTELIDIDRFNQTAWSALDEQEMNFTLIAEDFINGNETQTTFNSVEEMEAFVEFFSQTYSLTFRNSADYYLGYYDNGDGTYTMIYDRERFDTSREETTARRVATMQAVVEKYKLHAYENPYEEIFDIEDRINTYLCYNIDELKESTYGSLHTDEGVCAHYAAIFYILANAEGIPTEIVHGYYTDDNGEAGGHAWNEVHLDGQTITLDPTNEYGAVPDEEMWRYQRAY